MDKLTQLAKLHKDWVGIVNSFGEYFLAEDIVQETYIKIIRYNYIDKIVTEKVNRSMMWFVLRSVYIDHLRLQKHVKIGLDSLFNLSSEQINEHKHESEIIIDDKIKEEISKWHWYDQKLFNLYIESELSMRDIAKETDISLTSIFHTLKNCKEKLRQSVGDDFTDFLNEDYERIK